MARDTRRKFLEELAKVEPQIARAFEQAVQDIRSTAQASVLDDVIRRYAAGEADIHTAMREAEVVVQLGRQFWLPLDSAIVNAYVQGGAYQAGLVPRRPSRTAPRVVFRFDGRSPRAEAWTRDQAGALITEVGDDQRRTIRETIVEGVEDNRAYRRITRDLIGTTQGNQRKGGVVGLHSRQARAVRAARRELETGDSAYLGRSGETRDRRFDRTIRKAQREGRTLTADEIDRITGRYADGLLRYRGRLIARTEANGAMNAGRHEAMQQMIDAGQMRANLVTKVWVATVGKFTRDHHLILNGRTVKWGEKFISPATGFPMDRPHDPDAPAVDTAHCRCYERIDVNWLAMAQ